jgi:hypothetical protein
MNYELRITNYELRINSDQLLRADLNDKNDKNCKQDRERRGVLFQ